MKWNEGGQYENPPAGNHTARCIKLIDMGTQPTTFNGQTKYQRKVLVTFELPECVMEGLYKPEVKGKPFTVSQRYTQSLSPNASLRQDLEAWRGRAFTKEELAKFDPKGIIGRPVLLNLVENGEYINIGGLSPLPKGMKCPDQINPSVFFSLEPEEFDAHTLSQLPEKLREKIMASPEYKSLVTNGDPDPSDAGHGSNGSDEDCPF